jgi:hypothetical protein
LCTSRFGIVWVFMVHVKLSVSFVRFFRAPLHRANWTGQCCRRQVVGGGLPPLVLAGVALGPDRLTQRGRKP